MTKETLQKAIEESRRFLDKAQVAAKGNVEDPNKWNAAVKRASMDLSRALSELRARR